MINEWLMTYENVQGEQRLSQHDSFFLYLLLLVEMT